MSGPATGTPQLCGVVVHWHNETQLAELLAAWPADPRFELVVVDNGSTAALPEGSANVRWVRPGRNLGFAGGVNAGVATARAPLVLLLNPDALPEPGALDELLAGFEALPRAAGLAPHLAGPDGASQTGWQQRDLPSLAGCLAQALLLPLSSPVRPEPAAGTAVEQPAAAALALRQEALEAVGGMDERFYPAWFEDVDLARRLRQAGCVLCAWPAARFRHGLGSTVPRLGYGPFLWIYHRNLGRYIAKHHGTGWAGVARGTLAVGALLRLAALAVHTPRRSAGRGDAAKAFAGLLAGAVTGWQRPVGMAMATTGPGPSPPGPLSHPHSHPPGRGGTPAPALSEFLGGGALPPRGGGSGRGGPPVAICIVTHNAAPDLPGCLEAVAALEHRPLELVVVDCASRDGSLDLARSLAPAGIPLTAVDLGENLGFAGGMNAALAATAAPFALLLNADARPAPDYVGRLLVQMADPQVAAVTGRLVRPPAADGSRLLDACGMRLTRTWRHLDRGSGEPDRGQYGAPERVFGATGAASLFRRAALLDVAVDGEVFDPRFHSFREDAELCFRLGERGWQVVYEPAALAEHRRYTLPERRATLPPHVNRHSLKNRYLLRLYHQTAGNAVRTLLPTLTRDLGALGWVLLRERSSLPAYGWLWAHRRELWARRRTIQARRTVPPAEVDRWFAVEGEPL